jgi:hypothetical protein
MLMSPSGPNSVIALAPKAEVRPRSCDVAKVPTQLGLWEQSEGKDHQEHRQQRGFLAGK